MAPYLTVDVLLQGEFGLPDIGLTVTSRLPPVRCPLPLEVLAPGSPALTALAASMVSGRNDDGAEVV